MMSLLSSNVITPWFKTILLLFYFIYTSIVRLIALSNLYLISDIPDSFRNLLKVLLYILLSHLYLYQTLLFLILHLKRSHQVTKKHLSGRNCLYTLFYRYFVLNSYFSTSNIENASIR